MHSSPLVLLCLLHPLFILKECSGASCIEESCGDYSFSQRAEDVQNDSIFDILSKHFPTRANDDSRKLEEYSINTQNKLTNFENVLLPNSKTQFNEGQFFESVPRTVRGLYPNSKNSYLLSLNEFNDNFGIPNDDRTYTRDIFNSKNTGPSNTVNCSSQKDNVDATQNGGMSMTGILPANHLQRASGRLSTSPSQRKYQPPFGPFNKHNFLEENLGSIEERYRNHQLFEDNSFTKTSQHLQNTSSVTSRDIALEEYPLPSIQELQLPITSFLVDNNSKLKIVQNVDRTNTVPTVTNSSDIFFQEENIVATGIPQARFYLGDNYLKATDLRNLNRLPPPAISKDNLFQEEIQTGHYSPPSFDTNIFLHKLISSLNQAGSNSPSSTAVTNSFPQKESSNLNQRVSNTPPSNTVTNMFPSGENLTNIFPRGEHVTNMLPSGEHVTNMFPSGEQTYTNYRGNDLSNIFVHGEVTSVNNRHDDLANTVTDIFLSEHDISTYNKRDDELSTLFANMFLPSESTSTNNRQNDLSIPTFTNMFLPRETISTNSENDLLTTTSTNMFFPGATSSNKIENVYPTVTNSFTSTADISHPEGPTSKNKGGSNNPLTTPVKYNSRPREATIINTKRNNLPTTTISNIPPIEETIISNNSFGSNLLTTTASSNISSPGQVTSTNTVNNFPVTVIDNGSPQGYTTFTNKKRSDYPFSSPLTYYNPPEEAPYKRRGSDPVTNIFPSSVSTVSNYNVSVLPTTENIPKEYGSGLIESANQDEIEKSVLTNFVESNLYYSAPIYFEERLSQIGPYVYCDNTSDRHYFLFSKIDFDHEGLPLNYENHVSRYHTTKTVPFSEILNSPCLTSCSKNVLTTEKEENFFDLIDTSDKISKYVLPDSSTTSQDVNMFWQITLDQLKECDECIKLTNGKTVKQSQVYDALMSSKHPSKTLLTVPYLFSGTFEDYHHVIDNFPTNLAQDAFVYTPNDLIIPYPDYCEILQMCGAGEMLASNPSIQVNGKYIDGDLIACIIASERVKEENAVIMPDRTVTPFFIYSNYLYGLSESDKKTISIVSPYLTKPVSYELYQEVVDNCLNSNDKLPIDKNPTLHLWKTGTEVPLCTFLEVFRYSNQLSDITIRLPNQNLISIYNFYAALGSLTLEYKKNCIIIFPNSDITLSYVIFNEILETYLKHKLNFSDEGLHNLLIH